MAGALRKFEVVRREHAADRIFNQLAEAIMKGELAVGSALPPERALADQFEVSRTIVRQAVHRLAEIGLVRVRQGGATTVQDIARATDTRVHELRYRLGPQTDRQRREIGERRFFEGYALVTLASYRAKPEPIRAMLNRVIELGAQGADSEASLLMEREVWTLLAEATENDLYIAQATWWNNLIAERKSEPAEAAIPAAFRIPFYTELLTRIVEGRDAPGFYIETVRPLALGPPPLRG